MKKRIFVFLVALFMVFPFTVNADEINNVESTYSALNGLVTENGYTYYYVNGVKQTGFQVIMTNLTNDLYAKDIYGKIVAGGQENVFAYASGSYYFDIYSNDSNCPGLYLIRKTITLPVFNVYSLYDECKQYPNFRLCSYWGNLNISQEQFMSEFNTYKNRLENDINDFNEKNKTNIVDKLLDFLKENIAVIISLGVIVTLTIIILVIKKIRKRG